MRRVLIVQTGSADPQMVAEFGDYPAWFARHLLARVEVRVMRPYDAGAVLPSASTFDGVVVAGSPWSVTEPEPWMDRTGTWLLEVGWTRPVLGVCFGHQLLARALGGRVERNPLGREVGTVEVVLTPEGARDPLLEGLPSPLAVQQTHEDHVPELPPGATLLARNALTPVQAYAVGDLVRCVQFHPEFDAERSRRLAELRRARLDEQVPGGAAAVLASIRATPHTTSILDRWLSRFVGA